MAKKLYLYKSLEVCDPTGENAYHSEGGLVVITGGSVHEAVPEGTGDKIGETIGGKPITNLPAPDLVIEVSEYLDDVVIPFPGAGCC